MNHFQILRMESLQLISILDQLMEEVRAIFEHTLSHRQREAENLVARASLGLELFKELNLSLRHSFANIEPSSLEFKQKVILIS